jgi:hypothetical protein
LPFRVFGIAARPRSLPSEVVLFWNQLPVQSIWPTKVSPLLLLRSRFAVSTLPRLCGFPLIDCRRLPFKLTTASSPRAAPSYRVLPSNTYPTASAAESSHGLSFPSAHQEFEIHSLRVKPTRYVTPSGFGCPLGVLLPRIPRRFYFTPAALLGFTLRRYSVPRGFRSLSVRKNPPTVNPTVAPTPKRQTGPTDLGFWVQTSRGCHATSQRFRPRITDASLGFLPLQGSLAKILVGLLRRSSHVLSRSCQFLGGPTRTSEFQSIFTSHRPTNTGASTGQCNPHGVFAPARS